jgi:peptidoglycan/LPS O-acetylase OafA/YrhL
LSYNKEIDGLRAIAVISIILFHLNLNTFGGGFVGVDVFFVISGYLITLLIRDEVLRTGEFKYSQFYIRRARRLFPSLFFTLFLSFILAVLCFSQQDLFRFSNALATSAVGISNFFFWSESGYFDISADSKPLLHIWSLSVEEQFYLLWPLLIVFCLNKISQNKQPLVILILGTSSLFINFIFTTDFFENLNWFYFDIKGFFYKYFPSFFSFISFDGANTIFYIMPFRVFEFAIGAILVWLPHLRPKGKLISEILFLVGLVMILYPIKTYTEDTLFPSYNALLPCFGAALIIHSGTTQYAGQLLNNPISVGIGRISYSLYLIHWPIIVFYKQFKHSELILNEQLVIFFISILFAILMYHFIEQPFRKHVPSSNHGAWTNAKFCITYASLSFVIVFLSVSIKTDWLSWRIASIVKPPDKVECDTGAENHCLAKANKKYDFVILGDSFAIHHASGFEKLSKKVSKSFLIKSIPQRCFEDKITHDRQCIELVLQLKDFIFRNKIDRVVLSFLWNISTTDINKFFSDKRLASIKDFLFILISPIMQNNLAPRKCHNLPYIIEPHKNCFITELKSLEIYRIKNDNLKMANYSFNMSFIDPFRSFCNNTHCKNKINGQWVFYDETHFSKFGSIYFAEYFKPQILRFLLKP